MATVDKADGAETEAVILVQVLISEDLEGSQGPGVWLWMYLLIGSGGPGSQPLVGSHPSQGDLSLIYSISADDGCACPNRIASAAVLPSV